MLLKIMNDRKYIIIEANEVVNIDFNQVLENSADVLRYSMDGSKTFVKYLGETPDFLEGKVQYSHSEIRSILSGPTWTNPVP